MPSIGVVGLSALLLLSSLCRSAPAIELTLDEAIERALLHSHELAVARASLSTVDARLRRSEALLPSNPFIGASFWDTTSTQFVGDRERGIGPSFTLSLSQTFEIAGQRSRRIDVASRGVEVAQANSDFSRANLTAAVRRAFNDAIEAHARVGYAFEVLHWQRELTRAYARSGEAALNQAAIRVARAESEHESSKHSLFLLESRLRQVLQLAAEEPLVLVGELDEQIQPLPSYASMLAYALEHRADLAAHQSATAADDAALALARRRAIPDLTLSGFVTHSESSRDDVQFGASVGLPLPVFRRSGPDIDEAVAAQARSRADLDQMKTIVEREVREARFACESAAADVTRHKSLILPRTQDNVQLAETDFDSGRAGVWELVTAELDRVHARRDYTAALRIYNNAIVEVERVLGGSLADVDAQGGR